mmetsp:Transcript_43955/g.124445  ORF Transcript_43955/g.124445 Transcript_43955/m.124445 type:complete len:258 (-) Transcript_43955:156-929(-)
MQEGQSKVVRLLLRNGADPHIQDTVGRKSPLQMAATPLIRDQIKSHLRQKGELPVAEFRATEGAVDQATSPMQRGTMPQQPYSPPAEDKREREQQLAVEPSRTGPKEGQIASSIHTKRAGCCALRSGLSALSVSMGPLRERFMRLMLPVQQGGPDDLQHIKEPHLFTASWMEAIHTHQQLFQSIIAARQGHVGVMSVMYESKPDVLQQTNDVLSQTNHLVLQLVMRRCVLGVVECRLVGLPYTSLPGMAILRSLISC